MPERRCLQVLFPHAKRPGERYAPGVWCAPGIGTTVRRYVSDAYGIKARAVHRRRYLALDSGGAVVLSDPLLTVPFHGWEVRVRSMDASTWVEALERRLQRPLKRYPNGLEVVRVAARFYTAIMLPKHAVRVVQVLRPLAAAGDLALQRKLAELSQCVSILVPSVPMPAES